MNIHQRKSILRLIEGNPRETHHSLLMILLEHPERKYDDEDGSLLPPMAEERAFEEEIFDLIREKRQDVWQSYVVSSTARDDFAVFFTETAEA